MPLVHGDAGDCNGEGELPDHCDVCDAQRVAVDGRHKAQVGREREAEAQWTGRTEALAELTLWLEIVVLPAAVVACFDGFVVLAYATRAPSPAS